MRRQELPPDVGPVLEALAGTEATIDALAASARTDAQSLRDVLANYVQQVMLFHGAAPRRVLGVGAGASRAQMRAHMRLLMIWLHPDRSGGEWRAAFSARVLEAWGAVQGGEAGASARARTAPVAIPPVRPASRGSRGSAPRTRAVRHPWVQAPVARPPRARWALILTLAAGAAASGVAMAWVLGEPAIRVVTQ